MLQLSAIMLSAKFLWNVEYGLTLIFCVNMPFYIIISSYRCLVPQMGFAHRLLSRSTSRLSSNLGVDLAEMNPLAKCYLSTNIWTNWLHAELSSHLAICSTPSMETLQDRQFLDAVVPLQHLMLTMPKLTQMQNLLMV